MPASAFTKRKIVVCSAAYLGDVAPYIPVADRLVERGHEVTFLAPEGFRSILEGRHFSYTPYPLDFSSAGMHADPRHERLMRHPYRNSAQLGRYWMGKGFADDPVAAHQSLVDAFDGADVVVTHPTFGSVSIPVARSMGIPVAVWLDVPRSRPEPLSLRARTPTVAGQRRLGLDRRGPDRRPRLPPLLRRVPRRLARGEEGRVLVLGRRRRGRHRG